MPIVAVLLIGAVYWQVTGHFFVRWDDPVLVTENPRIQSFSPTIWQSYDPELYIPLTLLSYQVEYALFGLDPMVFHVTNLILHLIAVVLIFFLALTLAKNRYFAFGAALLFGLHPITVEAVAWVSARKDLLAAVCALGSLLSYLAYRKTWTIASVLLFACALLSKVTVLALPLLLPILDWHEGRKIRIMRYVPYILLSCIFGAVALYGKSSVEALLSPWQVILLSFRSTTLTLQHIFYPTGFSALYPASESVIQGIQAWVSLGIVGAILALLSFYRKNTHIILGAALFFLALLPTFLAYTKTNDVIITADRYAYLSLFGIIFMVMYVIQSFIKTKSLITYVVLIAALVTTLGSITYARIPVWADSGALFTDVLEKYPTSHVALNNIANLHLREKNLEQARLFVERALEYEPSYPDALVTLAAIEGREGNLDAAEELLQKAIEIDPRHPDAYFNLGSVYFSRNRLTAAMQAYERTLLIDAFHIPAKLQLAKSYLRFGEIEQARTLYVELQRENPGFSDPELSQIDQ